MAASAPQPHFRAVVGETGRNRMMDQTIRAILCPVAGAINPWTGYHRKPQTMRVQGNSKYVALRAVSTEPVRSDRVQLPALSMDASLRDNGTPGARRETPRMTFMDKKLEQITGGMMPVRLSGELEHFHRFNKSTTSLQLRRGLSKTPSVQMEYILNKPPKPPSVEQLAPVLNSCIGAFKRASLFKRKTSDASAASRAPSFDGTASGQSIAEDLAALLVN